MINYRLKWYGVLAIGVAFSVGGVGMAASGDARGWAVFLFFLFCAAMAVHELWPQVIERHRPTDPDAVLQRYPGPVTLRVPQMKLLFFFVSAIVFGGCLVWVALYGDLSAIGNFFLWLAAAGIAAACPIFAMMILRGSTLQLDASGMHVFQGWKRSDHRWTDLSEFSVADAGVLSPTQHLMVVFDEASTKDGTVATLTRSLLGKGGGLPDTYGMDPWHLAQLLNEWRERALATPQPATRSVPAP